MKHRQLFALGGVLALVILLATACAPATPENITITFTADEKCSLSGATSIPANTDVTLEVISNLPEDAEAGVGIAKLVPDKTIKDLEALPPDTGQPTWSLIVGFYSFPSDGNPHSIVLNQADGPIYFLCFTSATGNKIGALGPVDVVN